MKSIIKSGKLVNNVVTIITKSNVKKVYTFKTNKLARQYYNDVTNWIRMYLDNIIEYKNNKMNRIKFNHEQIASISALAFFTMLAILVTYVN